MLPLILLIIAVELISLAAIIISKPKLARAISIFATAFSLVVTLALIYLMLTFGTAHYESYGSLPYLGLSLAFNASGVSAALMLMAGIVLLAAAVSGNPEKDGLKLSSAMIVLFEIAAIGLFSSANLLLFFVFWDIGVVAMFIMINVLGSANRTNASMNFLLYEIFASSMLLLGIILLYVYAPTHSLDISYIISIARSLPQNVQLAVFLLFFGAFITNMPIFPLHNWLPDAHTEASTQGSMVLSGILTKFGGYGAILLFTILPIAHSFSIYVAALATFSSIYGAFLMLRQTDIKRIIAYSTIVEMGIILLAISSLSPIGESGAIFGMLSHGIVIALAFLSVGAVKYIFEERSVNRIRGIISSSKTTTYVFIIGAIAMIGFPLTSGFVSDILIFLGAIQSFGAYGLISLVSLLLMGAYLYTIISKCFLSTSEISPATNYIDASQKFGFAMLSIAIIILGIIPFVLINLIKI